MSLPPLISKKNFPENPVLLPELGEGITHATVAGWNVRVGDKVRAGEELGDLVTDKASFSLEASCSGAVAEILVPEGQEAAVGDVLAVIRPDPGTVTP